MRIAVLIKQVPDSQAVRMDESTGILVRDPADAVTNPLDLSALTLALRVAGKVTCVSGEGKSATITAVGMGPKSAERSLREALALGADGAVLVCDRLCAGSDTLATSKLLATTLKKLGPFDLVLCGLRATDGETGQVGPEIASNLGIALATYVESLEYIDDGRFEAVRRTEGATERIRFKTPALVSVTKGAGDPGLPTLERKKSSRRQGIQVLSVADLGLEPGEAGLAGSPTRVAKIFHPALARHGERIFAGVGDGMFQAVAALMKVMDDDFLQNQVPSTENGADSWKGGQGE